MTSSRFPSGTSEHVRPYIELISRFVGCELSADQFEVDYLRLAKSETVKLPPPAGEITNELFFNTDDYVSDPALRTEPEDLDGEQLREKAREALTKLKEAFPGLA